MTSKTPARSAEDVDEATLTYAEMKALATGNPMIKEKMDIDNTLQRMQMAQKTFLRDHEQLERRIKLAPGNIQKAEEHLDDLKQDLATVQGNTKLKESGEEVFSLELKGKTYTDKKEATAVIAEHLKQGNLLGLSGKYKGLNVQFTYDSFQDRPEISLFGRVTVRKNSSMIPGDNINRIMDLANSYGELITKQEQDIEELKKKFEDNKREFAKPSPYEEQINELMRRSAELTTLINEETKKNQPGEGEPVPVQSTSVKHSSRR